MSSDDSQAISTEPNAPPSTMGDLDRITDIVALEPVRGGPVDADRTGGQGAYCYYGPPERGDLSGTPLADWVDGMLRDIAVQYPNEEDFRIVYDGRGFRGCRDRSGLTTEIALRRLPTDVPSLSDLVFDQPITPGLLEGTWLNKGGLVILCGLYGSGKSTIGAATIKSRLQRFGGRCITVENPPEFPLEGKLGAGACRQLEVDYSVEDPWRRGFAGGLRRAHRKLPATRPGIIMVGEVRDTETAAESVKAALNGITVLTSMHASDPINAIIRLCALAQHELGDMANVLVGQAFRMCVHHHMTLSANVEGWKRGQYTATCLVSDSAQHPTANAIRTGRFVELNQIIAYQQSVMKVALQRQMTPAQYLDQVGARAMQQSQGPHGLPAR